MTRILLQDLKMALEVANVEPQKQQDILNHLEEVQKEIEAHKDPAPKLKNEFGVILYSQDPALLANQDLTATVFTIKEGDDMGLVLGKISASAKEQNAVAKKKNALIETIGAACQHIKRKFLKEKNVMIKTKIPVRVLVSNNQLV